ncbi:hypothetical protein EUX98_g1098 [Antrodiella citrinella]|uniref:Uncharacterized protein n=1 Tax=Antrodiella citrinella TaxID=2447956 RepID=A0A4V3XJH4_9APHY|nr:hypothetical protein EUX98_g1098 [Antrodiella citrinella]
MQPTRLSVPCAFCTQYGKALDLLRAAFDFYDYGRFVFDAAIVCAHTVIQQPTSILTTQAMQIVSGAMDLLHDLGGAREDGPNDAWKIVDMMRHKAELCKANGSCMDDANAGHKRKRAESDEGSFDNGLFTGRSEDGHGICGTWYA